MNVLGVFELTSAAVARRREVELTALRAEIDGGRRALEQAERVAAEAREARATAAARAEEAERTLAAVHTGCGTRSSSTPAGTDEPPAVARELIAMADRLVDLTGSTAPTDAEQATAVLRWLRGRVDALLALCEVAPITDDGVLNFMRHEVVADRPAPREELVDHIADTVRPGYLWRHDLLRPQQVVAYIAAER